MTPEEVARVVLDYDAEFTDALLFPLKECTICGRRRPYVETYFRVDRKFDSGLSSICRDCHDKRERMTGGAAIRGVSQREDIELAAKIVAELRKRGMRDSEIARAIGYSGGLHVMLRKSTVSREKLAALVDLAEHTKGGRSS